MLEQVTRRKVWFGFRRKQIGIVRTNRLKGFGYVKKGWGFLNWVRVVGIVSSVFFLIIGIAFLFSSIRGYQSYF